MRKRISTAAALLGVTALWVTIDQPVVPPTSTADDLEEDFTRTYLRDADLWQFDDSGKLTSHIVFASAEQPNATPVVRLSDIAHTGLFDGRTWQTTAGTGVLWDNNNRLNLEEDVQISASDSQTRLDAHHLNLDFNEQVARSGGPIVLTSSDSKTTGTGLDVDLANGTIRVRSSVKTSYEPRPDTGE